MRSQQDAEEDDYRTQQWEHLGRRNDRRGGFARPRDVRKGGMTGSLDPKNTTSYRLLLWLGLRGVRDDFPQ